MHHRQWHVCVTSGNRICDEPHYYTIAHANILYHRQWYYTCTCTWKPNTCIIQLSLMLALVCVLSVTIICIEIDDICTTRDNICTARNNLYTTMDNTCTTRDKICAIRDNICTTRGDIARFWSLAFENLSRHARL